MCNKRFCTSMPANGLEAKNNCFFSVQNNNIRKPAHASKKYFQIFPLFKLLTYACYNLSIFL